MISPTFNLEVRVGGREEARQFIKEDLAEVGKRFDELADTEDLYSEAILPDGGQLEFRFTEDHDHLVGNLGNWPAVVVSYSPGSPVAEMPELKRHLEVLDQIRDFFAARKPASDIKYYTSTRTER